MKIAFTTNLCAHYNIGTFEGLARQFEVDYFFFSDGSEWYWPREHRLGSGSFHFEQLDGFHIGGTRITPSLLVKLWRGNYDAYIKCINGRFALPATYLVARIKRKPFILWTGVWNRIETPVQKLIFPLTRYIYLHANAIVVYGQHVKEYLVREGVPAERIFVAAHAVDNHFYGRSIPASETEQLRASLNIAPDKKVVMYLGRLEESKGVRYLIEAFQNLHRSDCVLVIAGDGSLRPELEAISRRSDISERIRFTGYVPIDLAPLYYSLAWVYVLPSITVSTGKEPWGLVVNEAFNQGVPVIATDAVGAAMGGLVQDGVNGFVIPERDSGMLTTRLLELIDNPKLRHQFGVAAKKTVASWNYEQNIRGYRLALEYISQRD